MRHVFLAFFLLLGLSAFAQTSTRLTIRGTVVDTSNVPQAGATVMLLLPKDSTLASYGRSNEKGFFEFKNLKKTPYLLKITFVGCLPIQRDIVPTDDGNVDLGALQLKPIAKELLEVVIRTAKAPLTIRGDTVEYNASSFKVPPGATVEDLLRKLPGVVVDQDGGIKAQGQDVKKVTVDGKSFFGTDPKLATKNLAADAIAKVQIFNDKSEQSKITGVDDGRKEKTVNLELKESARKGGFGKITAGGGLDGGTGGARSEVKGNYNRFNTKNQFSIIALGNNTNQTGVSFDDYQDFRGSQSFNWNDDADFSFSSGGRSIFFGGDDDESLTIPISGRSGRGFSENFAGGINYNYDTKKTKLSSNYFFNQSNQTQDGTLNRTNFLQNGSFTLAETNRRGTFSGNHRGGLRFEKTIDTLNTLVLIGNGRYNTGNDRYHADQTYTRNEILNSTTTIDNATRANAGILATSAIFRHKFMKKGRNLALSASFNLTHNDNNGDQRSVNDFFGVSNPLAVNLNQITATDTRRQEFKSSAFFLEPLSKTFFWETFYNFSLRTDEVDRDVFDRTDTGMQFNTALSRYYTNEYVYHRLGSSFRYSNKGLNVSAGAAGQQFNLRGRFATDQTSATFTNVSRSFFAWVPNVSLNYDLKNNRYLYSGYNVEVRLPSTRDLQPVVDNSNPRYIREGNPDLLPQLTHRLNLGFSKFNPANFTNLFFNVNYGYNINQVVYNQTVDTLLITRTRPTNISGGQNVGSYLGFGFPLKKTKSNLNLNTSLNLGNNLAFVNDVLNRTRSTNVGVGLRLDLTPSEKFTLYTNANVNVTDAQYSINSSQNQRIFNYTYGAEMNAQFPAKIYLNANFNYRIFINRRFDFDQRVPILNLAVYKHLGKANRTEIRLTAYDVFNQNQGITQQATQNFVSEERVRTLARYFLLSLTYNMRGVKAQMRRGGGF